MRGRRTWRWSFLRAVVVCCVIGAILTVAGVGVLMGEALTIGSRLPSIDALDTPSSEATRIYAADGQLIASLYQENRESIPLSQIPVSSSGQSLTPRTPTSIGTMEFRCELSCGPAS